jgi:hypothetical protein
MARVEGIGDQYACARIVRICMYRCTVMFNVRLCLACAVWRGMFIMFVCT